MWSKSILTTLAGIVSAIGLSLTASEEPFMHMIGVILAAIGTFLTGLFAKQYNATGGTIPTTKEAEKRINGIQ